MLAQTPAPPYYAVIFTSTRSEKDNGYSRMADKMRALAAKQKGFLGIESVQEEIEITVSYWKDLESIKAWKKNAAHLEAQNKGKSEWYRTYKVRIARVEKDYGFEND